jgi:hypothetical protein
VRGVQTDCGYDLYFKAGGTHEFVPAGGNLLNPVTKEHIDQVVASDWAIMHASAFLKPCTDSGDAFTSKWRGNHIFYGQVRTRAKYLKTRKGNGHPPVRSLDDAMSFILEHVKSDTRCAQASYRATDQYASPQAITEALELTTPWKWFLIPIKLTDLEVGEAPQFSQEDRIKCLGSLAVCSPAYLFTMLEFMKRDDLAHLWWVNMTPTSLSMGATFF